MLLARICDAVGLDSVAAWLRARDEPLRAEDAAKYVAHLRVHGLRCHQCGRDLVDGDEVAWLQWKSGERTGMLHLACHEKLYATDHPDHHDGAADRQPETF